MNELNTRAYADSRNSRSGKDGALYNKKGALLATVESFASSANFTNGTYRPLGCAQEIETAGTTKVTLTITQIVIESDEMIQELMEGIESGEMPVWDFQGTLRGRNGSEERVVYRDCIPSGQIDIQNLAQGDTIKRNWNLVCNRPPKLQSLLTID